MDEIAAEMSVQDEWLDEVDLDEIAAEFLVQGEGSMVSTADASGLRELDSRAPPVGLREREAFENHKKRLLGYPYGAIVPIEVTNGMAKFLAKKKIKKIDLYDEYMMYVVNDAEVLEKNLMVRTTKQFTDDMTYVIPLAIWMEKVLKERLIRGTPRSADRK